MRKRKTRLTWIVLGVTLIMLASAFCIHFSNGFFDPYRNIEKLDVALYMENSNSLRGNIYQVTGEVANDLAYSPTKGRMFSFVGGDHKVIPIMIPLSLNRVNIQKGQNYIIIVEIKDNGLIEARKLTKA